LGEEFCDDYKMINTIIGLVTRRRKVVDRYVGFEELAKILEGLSKQRTETRTTFTHCYKSLYDCSKRDDCSPADLIGYLGGGNFVDFKALESGFQRIYARHRVFVDKGTQRESHKLFIGTRTLCKSIGHEKRYRYTNHDSNDVRTTIKVLAA